MGRVLNLKGGVWRNTEDEILKAGVMKYGKNQWSRIASLLHRKTAKQCKARWMEWLDPSIKKTEWSREEEEKLLHLAKLMPTQWRTSASLVGRTASQCLEHYEYLLDQANKKDKDEQMDDSRKLKPGELDPNPETKPARPDPKDMDEDELEMLSEARARLANTQGKKAKRKAREKQLEEARRLAALQKRRELRQAGIYLSKNPKGSKRKKGIDYNAEIPLQKQVPEGPFDTSNDQYEPAHFDFKKLRQQHLDGESRTEKEEKERKKDKQSQEKKENNMPPINFNFIEPIKKRSKLVLPEPQISDAELEQVVKIGKINSNALAEIDNDQTASQTARPLAGGNFTQASVRDNLSINPEEALALQISNQKHLIKENRDRLRKVLSELPDPKNEYEIVINEDNDEDTVGKTDQIELDQADVDQNLQKGIEDDLKNIKSKQTQAVQRQLPRPEVKPFQLERISENDLDKAKEMVDEEVEQLKKLEETKELNLDEFTRIWEECYSELSYLENENRFVRLKPTDRKRKIESLNYMFQKHKEHMNKEAKKAFKIEKKLKVLLGGYQSRSQTLINQLANESNELEKSITELNTFKMLKEHEEKAIEKRVGSVMADVKQQITREKNLQKRYDELKREKEEINGLANANDE